MNNEKIIKNFLKNNNGYISTFELLNLGITKQDIKKHVGNGLIEKVSHGLYMDTKQFRDEYYIIQKKYPNVIFSYNTALYILNLTNRTPINIDITLLRGKTTRMKYNTHYVCEKYYNVGIIETTSPNGNPIKVYNAERCICDILRTEDELDLELQNRVLNYYFNSREKDIDKLLEYAKIFNIYAKINTIVEVMMKW